MILKQIDHPKMKILSSFNHPPKLVPKLYEFLSCAEHNFILFYNIKQSMFVVCSAYTLCCTMGEERNYSEYAGQGCELLGRTGHPSPGDVTQDAK